MCEHRNTADRAEEIVGEHGRRLRSDPVEVSADVAGTPADVIFVDIDAIEVNTVARQETAGASAAPAPVKQRPEACEWAACESLRQLIELLHDRIAVEIEQELGFVAGDAQAALLLGHRDLKERIVIVA